MNPKCLICKEKIDWGDLFCDSCRQKDIFIRIKAFKEKRFVPSRQNIKMEKRFYSKLMSKFNSKDTWSEKIGGENDGWFL